MEQALEGTPNSHSHGLLRTQSPRHQKAVAMAVAKTWLHLDGAGTGRHQMRNQVTKYSDPFRGS